MARTKAGDPTPDERAAEDWAETLKTTPGAASEVEVHQLERDQAAEDVIEGHVTDLTQEAARRAAAYVNKVKLGPNMTTILMYVAAKSVDTAELNTVISEQLAARILNATSPDDIFDPFATARDKDFIGKNLWCEGVMYLDSDKTDGYPYYVSLDVRNRETGNLEPVIVGGEKLVPQVAGLDMHDAWPCMIRIGSTKTRQGFDVYSLIPVVPF